MRAAASTGGMAWSTFRSCGARMVPTASMVRWDTCTHQGPTSYLHMHVVLLNLAISWFSA